MWHTFPPFLKEWFFLAFRIWRGTFSEVVIIVIRTLKGSLLHPTFLMSVYLVSLHITFLSYDIPFTGKHEPNKLTCSPLCDFIAQLVRALHRHRRGHGFESR